MPPAKALLHGLAVLQLGPGLAAAVCGRLFADAGAQVSRVDHPAWPMDDPDVAPQDAARTSPRDNNASPRDTNPASPRDTDRLSPRDFDRPSTRDASDPFLHTYLDHGKPVADERTPNLIIVEGSPASLRRRRHAPDQLRARAPDAVLVLISPYGQTGPCAEEPATDLTLMAASGIMRMLTGQVDDLTEPPVRAVGEQAAFLGGIAAACAGMHAALNHGPSLVDVSMQEALATLAMAELSRAGQTGRSWKRRREADGNGATVCILPARDGYAAISPREERQWQAWLVAMGSPAWGDDPRFHRKPDRVANWDALHELMSAWSRHLTRQEIADRAQAAHVPSFPLREVGEHLASPQLAHRHFWRPVMVAGREVQAPGAPFGLQLRPGAAEPAAAGQTNGVVPEQHRDASRRHDMQHDNAALPLAGIRVLDFSWVIAGPTATRYLAAMGAEIIKVEAPGAGDPGRASGLHEVLGQGKRGIVLDLKHPAGVAAARELAARCDVVIENFATGVMDRLGLGADTLRSVNPSLIYVSASGLGRTGPDSHAVAYGTLLQCFAGFAGLNRHPDQPPRVGMAWLDPMCGLMLAFATAAAVWARRQTGTVARVDFSMVEAMLWTLAAPVLATQAASPPTPQGNRDPRHVPHGVYKCAGDDAWIALAIPDEVTWNRLMQIVPALAAHPRSATESEPLIEAWCTQHSAADACDLLQRAEVPCAVVADAASLVNCPHLQARGFWHPHRAGVLPGLPWHASFGARCEPAPALGADTDSVLQELLGTRTVDPTTAGGQNLTPS